jgi:hypothetical protein
MPADDTFSALAARVAGRLGIEVYRPWGQYRSEQGLLWLGESRLDFAMGRVRVAMRDKNFEMRTYPVEPGGRTGVEFVIPSEKKRPEDLMDDARAIDPDPATAILAAADRALGLEGK